jgi:hypothetical protein
VQAAFEPRISECDFTIAPKGAETRGSETSQYPQEKKSIEILLVTASKRRTGQTESVTEMLQACGVVGPSFDLRSLPKVSWNGMP